MRVVRLCTRAHPELDGKGAAIAGGRWNSKGTEVVYTSDCNALAILEYRVHMSTFPKNMLLLAIDLADTLKKERVSSIPNSPAEMQQIGDEWINSGSTAILEVPSVVAPGHKNYLLNPAHPDFAAGVKVVENHPFAFDLRLLSVLPAP